MNSNLLQEVDKLIRTVDGIQLTDEATQVPDAILIVAESLRLEYHNQLHNNKLDPSTIEQFPPAIEQEQLNIHFLEEQISATSIERTAETETLQSALAEKEAEISFAVSLEETTEPSAKGALKTVKKFSNETSRKGEIALRMSRSQEFQQVKRELQTIDQGFREKLRELYLKKATSEARVQRLKSELGILMLKLEFQLLGKR